MVDDEFFVIEHFFLVQRADDQRHARIRLLRSFQRSGGSTVLRDRGALGEAFDDALVGTGDRQSEAVVIDAFVVVVRAVVRRVHSREFDDGDKIRVLGRAVVMGERSAVGAHFRLFVGEVVAVLVFILGHVRLHTYFGVKVVGAASVGVARSTRGHVVLLLPTALLVLHDNGPAALVDEVAPDAIKRRVFCAALALFLGLFLGRAGRGGAGRAAARGKFPLTVGEFTSRFACFVKQKVLSVTVVIMYLGISFEHTDDGPGKGTLHKLEGDSVTHACQLFC